MTHDFCTAKQITEEIDEPSGHCFHNCGKIAMNDPTYTLCHGIVRGRGGEASDKWFAHAWLERDGIARDVTHDKWIDEPREMDIYVYRQIGNARDVIEYTHEQLLKLLCKNQHWGPWEF